MTTEEKLDLIIKLQQENNLRLQAIGQFIYDNQRNDGKDFSMDLIANLLAGNMLFNQGR